MSKRSLVILAGGMGSRFGGVKQLEPIGPNGEIIADYSVYDALQNGFERVVFVVREEHLDIFKEKITKKFQDKIEVVFAIQRLEDIPSDVSIPEGRSKMWGTAHALLAAKDCVDGPFLMINADDFYGRDSYKKAKEFFDNNESSNDYVLVSYPFLGTSSKNGAVKRGVIKGDFVIEDIIESEISVTDEGNIAKPLNGSEPFKINDNHPVSMSFFGFKPSIFEYLKRDFDLFIHGNIDEKSECLTPDVLRKAINNNEIIVYNIMSNAKWFGMTYREDLEEVKKSINKLIEEGEYPEDLWR